MESKIKKNYYTVKELAEILKVSRVTVFNKIKNGRLKAEKIGKTYIIPKEQMEDIYNSLPDQLKKEIDKGVAKVVKEYGDTLKMLGKE